MRAVVLVAHGSRVAVSNDEVRQLAQALQQKVAERYQRVEAAFLELAQPSIEEAIAAAIAAGAASVLVLPYFLAAGKHVTRDVPEIVSRCRQAHPAVDIELADYLGKHPGLLELLAQAL